MLRIAEVSDLSVITELCTEFYASTPHRQFAALDQAKMKNEILRYISGDRREQVVILAETKGRVFGLLSAMAVPVFFSSDKRAYESVWYVCPEYSRHKDSIRLFRAYEYWARTVGCTSISASTMVNPRLERFYEAQGYTKIETSFVKVIHGY